MKTILVTGCAGFIGFHLCQRLLTQGDSVWGLDNLNEYYDVNLKKARLARIGNHPHFHFVRMDLGEREKITDLFRKETFEIVVNLAAQAGVRHSLSDPHAYAGSNLTGFVNVLEGCRQSGVGHLIFASSSSVYGASTRMPFSTHDPADHPLSLYAATKRANELLAHAYAHLYRLPSTGLRFFTVYGPWGRPDMALFIFTKSILAGKPVDVFNSGKMQRDFTYVDDIVEGIVRVMERPPQPSLSWNSGHPDPASSSAPYRLYNVGSSHPEELLTLLRILESKLGKKAQLNMLPLQPGDAPATCAGVDDLEHDTGFKPATSLETGIERFVRWYREYYGV